jgi:hypothetical protein
VGCKTSIEKDNDLTSLNPSCLLAYFADKYLRQEVGVRGQMTEDRGQLVDCGFRIKVLIDSVSPNTQLQCRGIRIQHSA